jgi:hypothetical protein
MDHRCLALRRFRDANATLAAQHTGQGVSLVLWALARLAPQPAPSAWLASFLGAAAAPGTQLSAFEACHLGLLAWALARQRAEVPAAWWQAFLATCQSKLLIGCAGLDLVQATCCACGHQLAPWGSC